MHAIVLQYLAMNFLALQYHFLVLQYFALCCSSFPCIAASCLMSSLSKGVGVVSLTPTPLCCLCHTHSNTHTQTHTQGHTREREGRAHARHARQALIPTRAHVQMVRVRHAHLTRPIRLRVVAPPMPVRYVSMSHVTHCNTVMRITATQSCNALQRSHATHCNTVMQHTAHSHATHCNTVIQHSHATHCNTVMQHTATQSCNTLQHSHATHCSCKC